MRTQNASEQATVSFYQWEHLGRGYFNFETPVDIEPPYIPYNTVGSYMTKPTVDDGRVPSIFKQISNLLNPPKKEESSDEFDIVPYYLDIEEVPALKGITISFPKGYEVKESVVTEFLNVLSFTSHPISFEILARFEKLQIQFVGSTGDIRIVEMQLRAFFPEVVITALESVDNFFKENNDLAITDFGLNEEFMRPINTVENFSIDPLTSVIASMEHLHQGETILLQIIFRGVSAPWSRDINYAVSDGKGGSFFVDAPEMPNCAKDKTAQPLFSVVMRSVAQGMNDERSAFLITQLSQNITGVTTSRYNKLIPLSNEGYEYNFHYYNVFHRTSNRIGFILNTKELATLVHYPNHTVVSELLHVETGKTRRVPKSLMNLKYKLGTNTHRGTTIEVSISDEHKLRHCHIIGSTGVGKSTLIANMVIQDMDLGNGLFLFDPHGDIVEDVIARVPEHRINDVIIFDPYDTEYPIGFNLLQASTDAEKIVLSSDLVGIFKRFATSWGDNMSSVLAQVVNAFLESERGGTLIELKRFLLEESFRKEFLTTITDPSIHYYWEHEYGYLKNRISPLLTRIDTFLRPKVVRYMLAQSSGIDFKAAIEQKKVVLFKLSQGLIGEDNSYLLGSLFLSKINQVALGRQSMDKAERHPFYVYLDEFQNFITPSISSILSGARKYGLGLVLAHQDLNQISDYQVINSVLTNPNIRICFKLGDADAQRLQGGFEHFDGNNLQSLHIGQAIVRVGSSSDDFNLSTERLSTIDSDISQEKRAIILQQTRKQYGSNRNVVEALLEELLPQKSQKKNANRGEAPEKKKQVIEHAPPTVASSSDNAKKKIGSSIEKKKSTFIQQAKEKEGVHKHRTLQNFVRILGIQQGLKVSLEKKTTDGGKVDVVVENTKLRIAIEISVTNSVENEVANIKKCLKEEYDYVVMFCNSELHLSNIKTKALEVIGKKEQQKLVFTNTQSFPEHLFTIFDDTPKTSVKKSRGYRVKTNHIDISKVQNQQKSGGLRDVILQSIKKIKEK